MAQQVKLVGPHDEDDVAAVHDAVAELLLDQIEAELEVVVHAPLGHGHVLGDEVPPPRARRAVEERAAHAVAVAQHGRVEVRRRPEAEHGEAGARRVPRREGPRAREQRGELVRPHEARPRRRVVRRVLPVRVVDEQVQLVRPVGLGADHGKPGADLGAVLQEHGGDDAGEVY